MGCVNFKSPLVREFTENTTNNVVGLRGEYEESYNQLKTKTEEIVNDYRAKFDAVELFCLRLISASTEENKINQQNTSKERPSPNYLDQTIDLELDKPNNYSLIDYFIFENKFRGNRAHIKNTFEKYLTYFDASSNVLDLGCGRGELLERLKERGIKARGVDKHQEFITYCTMKGLDVINDDILSYLENQQQNSLGGIFAGQIIEHLNVDGIVSLCANSYRALRSGCYLVMETPNPTSLSIFYNSFYIDPTHSKPVHPALIGHILESCGFQDIQFIYSSKTGPELPEIKSTSIENIGEVNAATKRVSDLLYGYQDYSVIARK